MTDTMPEDHKRDLLMQRIIAAISTASVPHEHKMPGALDSRSLSYYLSVGIDYLGHDHDRHEALLRRAASLVLEIPELAALKLTIVKPLNLGPSISTGTKKDD